MTKPAAHKKHTTGRSWNLSPIVKQAARVVGYLVASLVLAGVVASCTASVKATAHDCDKVPEVCL